MKRLFFIISLFSGSIILNAQPEEPILMLHSEMHSATINSISTDAKGQFLLTCSDDKTARLWDASTGNRLRTFRPPVGYGNEGRLFACALSPDGNIAATGGQTGSSWNIGDSAQILVGSRTIFVQKQQFSVYLFETTTGDMRASIDNLNGEILDLKFSPDGKYLLAALSGTGGVSVIETESWKKERELVGYGKAARCMAFSSKGELAVVSDDRYIRIYDNALRIKKTQTLPSGKEPVSVDWSPKGNQLMVACADLNYVLVLDAESLTRTVMDAPVSVKQPFVAVAFTPDGNRYAAGNFKSGAEYRIRSWQGDAVNVTSFTDFSAAQSNITAMKALPDGSLVFCTSYPEIGRISNDGKSLTQWTTGNTNQAYVRTAEVTRYDSQQRKSFQVNDDGSVVGLFSEGKNVVFFSLLDRDLKTAPSSYPTFNTQSSRTKARITGWENTPAPLLNNKVLNFLEKGELSRCVDVLPNGERMIFGADKNIYCLDKEGEIVWKRPTVEACAAAKITGNGEMAVMALNDGTVCWYRMSDGKKLLTLFAHPDRRRWVLWTDDGFYDCAMGAEDLIGWHLNQGKENSANFYPISQFRSTFFRPDVVNVVLNAKDDTPVPTGTPTNPDKPQETISIVEALPPDVTIISPRPETEITTRIISIEYNVRLPGDEGLNSVKVLINGRPLQLLTAVSRGRNEITLEVPAHDCEVTLIAKNNFGPSVPVSVSLKWKGINEAEEKNKKPKLYVLAVGVSQYDNHDLRLQYAAKDAGDFVKVMSPQKDVLYDDVEIKLLTDKNATKDKILEGLEWLKSNTKSTDLAMLFIAGHGMNDETGSFYYLPVNADIDNIQSSCVNNADIQKTVSSIAGKIIMFVDACHSGSVGRSVDLVGMVNELTDAENGVVVFTSSTGRQFSFEDAAWNNGAFTKALVEGIEGKADLFDDKKISFKTLDTYITRRVANLTGGKQTPTTIVPQSIPDFTIAML